MCGQRAGLYLLIHARSTLRFPFVIFLLLQL
jgi:hypothetical protein